MAGLSLPGLLTRSPVVGVIRLAGLISPPGGLRTGALSLETMAEPIARAFEVRRLAEVALAINSPGGSPVQSSLIAQRIRALAEEKKVRVTSFVQDVGASGGYWLACAGDEILCDESSILGSIGVVSAGFGFARALARIGVERRVYTAGARKMLLDPFGPEREEEVARLRAVQADIHESFKAWVRSRRGDRLRASEEELFSGEFWTGRRAVALGLADGIGELRATMRERHGEKVRFAVFGAPRRPFWTRLFPGSDSLAQAAADIIAERAAFARYGL
ncbi:S49 family peptidase [Elioraea tepida]|jgi:signal peptide peptidase SppA|uniref:S49 family peptidase n=1 Tax=Elioraea tepida TaxID=2843330 RepID=A0A975YKI1_9PROT|nr:S49 family peptidase [Elioraea tepida]QXM25779.1 S49 family peptidase [Elioraea tepida]